MTQPTRINILHLTDLHVGQNEAGEWRATFSEALATDLKNVRSKVGPIDVVVFTGDLAQAAKAEQYRRKGPDKQTPNYDTVEEILGVIFEAIESPGAVLLAVPGNHDLDRKATRIDGDDTKFSGTARDLREDPGLVDSVCDGSATYALEGLKLYFKAYTAWWEATSDKWRPKSLEEDGLLPGDWSWVLQKGDIRIGFVGLNSTWLDFGDPSTQGTLRVSVAQINKVTGGNAGVWAKSNKANFLLTHHPRSWLAPKAQAQLDLLQSPVPKFYAHLCGHLHEGRFTAWSTDNVKSGFRQWQSASLYGREKITLEDGTKDVERKNGYTIVQLEIGVDGAIRHRMIPRLAVPDHANVWRLSADVTYNLKDDILATDSWDSLEPISPESHQPKASPKPINWVEAVASSPLWGTAPDDHPWRVAASALAATWMVGWTADLDAMKEDPWQDRTYVLRAIGNLEVLCADESQMPVAVAHMLLAPMARERLIARVQREIADAAASQTDGFFEAHEALRVCQETYRSLRGRCESSQGGPARWWLIRQAALRYRCLWDTKYRWAKETSKEARLLLKQIGGDNAEWGGPLGRLAAAVATDPASLESEEGIHHKGRRPTVGGELLDLELLAWRLLAASALAMPLEQAEDVVADAACLSGGFEPKAVVASANVVWVRPTYGATWRADGVFTHPVPHLAISGLVRRADSILVAAHRAGVDRTGRLNSWPARVDDGGLVPEQLDGRVCFTLPHVRFRLDHERVRDLLVGEQLYGAPEFAFRELYQNALDACRYRAMREAYLNHLALSEGTWVGSIQIRELGHNGSRIVECIDNGIGMDRHTLEQVFAIGGRRFLYQHEYREERAEWEAMKLPAHYPNSRFGIGVLSYFMVAEELEVRTRRFHRDGSTSEKTLVARIRSASGLFLVEELDDAQVALRKNTIDGEGAWPPIAGTVIRLLGVKAKVLQENSPIRHSGLGVLAELVRIADYDLKVHSATNDWSWSPKEILTRGRPISGAIVPIAVPKDEPSRLWWSLVPPEPRIRLIGPNGNLLADGIVVGDGLPWVIANLRGTKAPLLDASRNKVHGWAEAWVIRQAMQAVGALSTCDDIPLSLLWWVEMHSPRAGRALLAELRLKQVSIRLGRWSFSAASTGCFFPDESSVFTRTLSDAVNWDNTAIQAWRFEHWRLARGDTSSLPMFSSVTLGRLQATPGDAALLGFADEKRDIERSLSVSRTVTRASLIKRSAQAELSIVEAAERLLSLEVLGVRPLGWSANDPIFDEVVPPVLRYAAMIEDCLVLNYKAVRLWLTNDPSAQPCDLIEQRPALDRLSVNSLEIDWDTLRDLRLSEEQRQVLSTHDSSGRHNARRVARGQTNLSTTGLSALFPKMEEQKPNVIYATANPLARIAGSQNLDGQSPEWKATQCPPLRLLAIAALSDRPFAEVKAMFASVDFLTGRLSGEASQLMPDEESIVKIRQAFRVSQIRFLGRIDCPSLVLDLRTILGLVSIEADSGKFEDMLFALTGAGIRMPEGVSIKAVLALSDWHEIPEIDSVIMSGAGTSRSQLSLDGAVRLVVNRGIESVDLMRQLGAATAHLPAAFGTDLAPTAPPRDGMQEESDESGTDVVIELKPGRFFIDLSWMADRLAERWGTAGTFHEAKWDVLPWLLSIGEPLVVPLPHSLADWEPNDDNPRQHLLLVAILRAAAEIGTYAPSSPWAELGPALRWYAWWADEAQRNATAKRIEQEGWLQVWFDAMAEKVGTKKLCSRPNAVDD